MDSCPGNQVPLADAGPEQNATAGALVTLDGSGSSDPDADVCPNNDPSGSLDGAEPLAYAWTQTSGPVVTLADADSATPQFETTGIDGALVFQLTVTDTRGATASHTVTVTVTAAIPPPDEDADGVTDGLDDCPAVADATQTDTDGDGIGDACDKCPSVSNADQADADDDGTGDACDPSPVPLKFVQAGSYAVGSGGYSVASGQGLFGLRTTAVDRTGQTIPLDLNQDGRPDIVIGDDTIGDANHIFVLLNKGDGTLNDAVSYDVSGSAGSNRLACGDVDADGDIDLVSTHAFQEELVIFRNQGNGTFLPAEAAVPVETIGVGVFYPRWVSDLELGDLDQDGDLDVVVPSYIGFASEPTGGVYWMENTRDETLAGWYQLPIYLTGVGRNPKTVGLADLDGDGRVDIAVGSGGALGEDAVYILRNQGGSTFAASGPFGSESLNPLDLHIADLNADGLPDIVMSGGWTNSVSLVILLNAGNLSFSPAILLTPYGETSVGSHVCAADFDGDGDVDIMTNSEFEQSLHIFPNDGQGGFSEVITWPLDSQYAQELDVADVDGDGKPDIVMSYSAEASSTVTVLRNETVPPHP